MAMKQTQTLESRVLQEFVRKLICFAATEATRLSQSEAGASSGRCLIIHVRTINPAFKLPTREVTLLTGDPMSGRELLNASETSERRYLLFLFAAVFGAVEGTLPHPPHFHTCDQFSRSIMRWLILLPSAYSIREVEFQNGRTSQNGPESFTARSQEPKSYASQQSYSWR